MRFVLALVALLLLGAASAERPIFLAPHSHCDAGWTSTFEQYYQDKVRFILPSVIDQLASNAGAVFNWAETGFLDRWIQDSDTARLALLQQFINNGRISFAGAGWVQNDEAVCHYRSVINQMTEGHTYLIDRFGEAAKSNFGWQIDPFGHSAATPLLFALMGMSATVTDRVNQTFTVERMRDKVMDFVWRAPPPFDRLGYETSIFTHQLGMVQYVLPGFVFESGDGGPGDPPVTPRNARFYRALFNEQMALHADGYDTPMLLTPWGGDFLFYNKSWEWVNMAAALPTQSYSTVWSFFQTAHGLNRSWPVYTGDFLPYGAVVLPAWWTGYYTSRAGLKEAVRAMDSLLETADSFFSLASRLMRFSSAIFERTVAARRYSGILCHHDAVTGTSRQHVVDDYYTMTRNATAHSRAVLQYAVAQLTGVVAVTFEPAQPFVVVASTEQNRIVRITDLSAPSGFAGGVACQRGVDSLWAAIVSSRFSIVSAQLGVCAAPAAKHYVSTPFSVSGGAAVTLQFGANQWLQSVTVAGVRHPLAHSMGRYWSVGGSSYLIHTDNAGTRPLMGHIVSDVVAGPLLVEVRQHYEGLFASNISWVFRIYANESFVEIDYTYGIVDGGFDYITRFQTAVNNSDGALYTDDSGLVTMQRHYDGARTIEKNYWPQVEHVALSSASENFTIVTSQPHGVTTPVTGMLEMMMFRRLLAVGVPPQGMGEPMDDTAPLKHDVQRMFFAPPADPRVAAHRVALNNWPVVMYAPVRVPPFQAVLPNIAGLHVLSLKMRNPTTTMLRLQNLRLDTDLSVNLSQLFGIMRATEYGLSFATNYTAIQTSRLEYAPVSPAPRAPLRHRPVLDVGTNATIEAGMIRSFLVQ